ncbi:Uncharacterised protein [Streptococcus pneumoniae]|nr:Uncharacterised protein [Streptococcus pneumoniae]
MCFTHSFFHFAILRKSLQTASASITRGMVRLRQFHLQPQNSVLDFVSSIHNLKAVL